ncbi:hypothetical protein ACWD4G_33325 [Streptomyces sp. NPDC002643]
MSFPMALGLVLMMFGCFALVAQSGNFVDYRLMRNLKHHGVDGQVVYKFYEYVTNSHRAFFKERPVVLLMGGTGLVLLGVGALLCLINSAT